MKRSGKEIVLLVLVTILWIGMVLLYWPVALIFLVPIAIHLSGRRTEEKYAMKLEEEQKKKAKKI